MRALSICKITGSKENVKGEWYWRWQIREFYVRPCSDGSYAWSRSCNRMDMDKKPQIIEFCKSGGLLSKDIISLAIQYSQHLKIPFVPGIYSGLKIQLSPIEMLSLQNKSNNRKRNTK